MALLASLRNMVQATLMPHGNSLHQLPDDWHPVEDDRIEFWPAVRFFGKLLLILAAIFCWIVFAKAQTIVVPLSGQANLVPIQNSATGTTAAVNTALPGYANKWTYICGFVITSAGTSTSTVVTASIIGIATPMNFVYNYVSSGQGILGVALPACVTASNQGSPITVGVPGGGAGTTVAVSAWGFAN
jgi:hypothetical protein